MILDRVPGLVTSVIGADPGPTCGLAFLDFIQGKLAGKTLLQVDGQSVIIVLEAMISRYYTSDVVVARYAGVENFITGQSAGTRGNDANITRQLVMQITERLQMWGYNTKIRSASDAKNWATDKKLEAAGIIGAASLHGKFRDGYDAARHALFTAREMNVIENPLR